VLGFYGNPGVTQSHSHYPRVLCMLGATRTMKTPNKSIPVIQDANQMDDCGSH
jgi:hypothetical protein